MSLDEYLQLDADRAGDVVAVTIEGERRGMRYYPV